LGTTVCTGNGIRSDLLVPGDWKINDLGKSIARLEQK
jgi:hypothetical protein